MSRTLRVLYIGGAGRSGSTLLGNILGQIDGFFHVGELASIWEVSLERDKECGCGKKIRECSVWSAVLATAFGSLTQEDVGRIVEIKHSRMIRTHEVLARTLLGRQSVDLELEKYAEYTLRLYSAIQHVTDCTWIIDGSKIPSHAYLLSTLPDVEIHVVHLIRDARAVYFSWTRSTVDGFRPNLQRAMMSWSIRNAVLQSSCPRFASSYHRVRYEDFVRNPQSCMGDILASIGADTSASPILADNTVNLEPCHSVWGNPNRMQVGPIQLQLDDDWRARMPSRDKLQASFLTWPLLLNYGYG